jgi:hypothetical protein
MVPLLVRVLRALALSRQGETAGYDSARFADVEKHAFGLLWHIVRDHPAGRRAALPHVDFLIDRVFVGAALSRAVCPNAAGRWPAAAPPATR